MAGPFFMVARPLCADLLAILRHLLKAFGPYGNRIVSIVGYKKLK